MAGKAVSKANPSNTEIGEKFWVKRPISNDSREIRKIILIEYFGFTETDIDKLDIEKPGYFYISDKRVLKDWASKEHVKSWPVNGQGEVLIDMPQTLVKFLHSFREQRVEFEAFRAGQFIMDGEIQKSFVTIIRSLLSQSHTHRINAMNSLYILASTTGKNRKEVYLALRWLMNEGGYKGNSFLFVAAAATVSFSDDKSAFSQTASFYIQEALKYSNISQSGGTKRPSVARTTISEILLINSFAAQLFDRERQNDLAVRRRKVVRLLALTEQEKDLLEEGDVIGLNSTEVLSISAPSQATRELNKLDEEWSERQKMEQQIRSIGNEPPPTDPSFDQYFHTNNDRLVIEGAVLLRKKRRRLANGKLQPKLKEVSSDQPVSRLGSRPDWPGGSVYLLTEMWKYMAADRRMRELAEYKTRRRGLIRRVEYENTVVIPPSPKKVQNLINDVRKYGRNHPILYLKYELHLLASDLEILLEQSYAYHGKN